MDALDALTVGNWSGQLGKGLAARELECVLAIACGHTSKQIAKILGVSPASVDKRVFAASTKLGVIKRAALVAEAMRRGLIAFSTGMTPSPHHHDNQESGNGVLIA